MGDSKRTWTKQDTAEAEKLLDEQHQIIQTMGEVLSEVCHTLLAPRDDGNFNVIGRMPSHKMVSFSPRTSSYVHEALREANKPKGGE